MGSFRVKFRPWWIRWINWLGYHCPGVAIQDALGFSFSRQLHLHCGWCNHVCDKRGPWDIERWEPFDVRGQGGFIVIVGFHNAEWDMNASFHRPISGSWNVEGRPFTVHAHSKNLKIGWKQIDKISQVIWGMRESDHLGFIGSHQW